MSHAPGPWYIAPRSKYLIRSKDYYICRVIKSKTEPSLNVAAEADAKLITAAPELLEALKLLTDPLYLAGLNQSAEHHPFIAKARFAITKATGEQACGIPD